MTDTDRCRLLRRLDIEFRTSRLSPLHHDNRCRCR